MLLHMRWDKAVVALLWLVFSIWTYRKLSAPGGEDREDRVARKYGVNQFGLFLWAGMTVGGALVAMQSYPAIPLWQHAAFMAFVMFPICAWGGYFWGKAMSGLF